MAKSYDVIIIGAGPAGMTAALYASRANLSVLLLDRGIYGGQMNNTAAIENYPGFKSVLGPDLAKDMYESATQFGAEYAYGSVESVEDRGDVKIVTTDSDTFEAKALVIGTGSEYRKLGVTGEDTYGGRGVSYCAVCDGAFFRNKHVVVVGGGDSAIEEGTYLTQLADKVTVIHRRDQLRAQQILQDRAFANPKMEFVWNSNVTEIIGDDKKLRALRLTITRLVKIVRLRSMVSLSMLVLTQLRSHSVILGLLTKTAGSKLMTTWKPRSLVFLQSVMFVRKIYAKLRRRSVKAELPVKAFTLISLH